MEDAQNYKIADPTVSINGLPFNELPGKMHKITRSIME
jgi:hypothetical protein